MTTTTSSFGTDGRRESHDSSKFYAQFGAPVSESAVKSDGPVDVPVNVVNRCFPGDARNMHQLPDESVALMFTSPPYFAAKESEGDYGTFDEYLGLLADVWAEVYRVLEPGGRAVVNCAGIGRRPYRDVPAIITQQWLTLPSSEDDPPVLDRGRIVWAKADGASGSCAWGSWRSASNPTIRDVHEMLLAFSKCQFKRAYEGRSTISRKEFMDATLSVWRINAESAQRVGHPAPFPVALARRVIELYTYEGDLVLDPFMGSGTTAVAATQLDRRWVGYETDAEWVALTESRVAQEGVLKAPRPVRRRRPRAS